MKKLTVLLLLTLIAVSPVISQTASDSVTLPRVQVLEAMHLNEVRKVQARELGATIIKGYILDSLVQAGQEIVSEQRSTIEAYLKLMASCRNVNEIYLQKVIHGEADILQLQKQLLSAQRKERRTRFFYKSLTIALGGATVWALLK